MRKISPVSPMSLPLSQGVGGMRRGRALLLPSFPAEGAQRPAPALARDVAVAGRAEISEP